MNTTYGIASDYHFGKIHYGNDYGFVSSEREFKQLVVSA